MTVVPASLRGRLRRSPGAPVRGRFFGVRTGQVVATQVTLALLLIGAAYGTVTFAASAFLVVVLLAITWLRLNGRWAFEWAGIATRFFGRERATGDPATADVILAYARPAARFDRVDVAGAPAAVMADGTGRTMILDLGDAAGLLAEQDVRLPAPADLLPTGDDHPPHHIQLLLTGVPAPSVWSGHGQHANSYRRLTDGSLLGHHRALLAVRVLSAEGWSPPELVRSLTGTVRRIRRRLGDTPAVPLEESAVRQVLAEIAYDGGHDRVAEGWAGLRVGTTVQAAYRLRSRTGRNVSPRLLTRLMTLPAAVTVAATAISQNATGRNAATELAVRLTAPTTSALAQAEQELHRLLTEERLLTEKGPLREGRQPDGRPLGEGRMRGEDTLRAQRLDGEHRDGLAATLPLGVRPPGEADPTPDTPAVGGDLVLRRSGVMTGRNRTGDPVVVRLFRPEPTRVLLVGGVRAAQLTVFRAMAVGARVVVQTSRPHLWERFVGGASAPGEPIVVVPPGRPVEIPAGTAVRPLLVVVDAGPVGADHRPGPGWQATLVVRDDFGPADTDVAARADLVVSQPLTAAEADLLGDAIGLGPTAELLTRIRPDMVGLVNRRAVRWAALAPTPIETQLIGTPVREPIETQLTGPPVGN